MSEQHDNGCQYGDLAELEQLLGYTFQQKQLLERALTHRSVHHQGERNDYERLEFLGDAVIDLSIAQLLLDRYPQAREGELSKMRAALVNTSSLAEIARKLDLKRHVRLSRSESANGGAERPSILADVFEALMGAMYREGGFETAHSCIERLFDENLSTVTPHDPKTELQEVLHALGGAAPEYLLESVEGPEHAPTFVSVVQVSGKCVGRGRGGTKKASQQEAAAEALRVLERSPVEMSGIPDSGHEYRQSSTAGGGPPGGTTFGANTTRKDA